MEIGARIVVHGLVQGVGFRYFVRTHAMILNIAGYVSNLENGDVLIEAEADRSLLEQLIKEVRIGPRFSRVTGLDVEWSAPRFIFENFEVR